MMDDIGYSNRAVSKINAYLGNHFILGEQFLITFESSSIRLKMDLVEETIIHFKEYSGLRELITDYLFHPQAQ